MSVITYLITLLSYSRIAHCSANLSGLCVLHLLARAISEHYTLGRWTATMCCDNKRALTLSSHHNGRIRPSAKCTDIRWSFKATKQTYQVGFKYIHVYGHMDQHLLWTQLSLTQQLNYVCDTLAKQTVSSTIIEGYNKGHTQILPREDVALLVRGDKITGNISGPLRFHASKVVARKYHTHQRKKGKWTQAQFEEVDWDHLHLALNSKADNYKI
jgi:hypothetical protein